MLLHFAADDDEDDDDDYERHHCFLVESCLEIYLFFVSFKINSLKFIGIHWNS